MGIKTILHKTCILTVYSFVSLPQVVVVQNKIIYYDQCFSALHSPHAVLLYCSQTLFIDCEHT